MNLAEIMSTHLLVAAPKDTLEAAARRGARARGAGAIAHRIWSPLLS